MACASRRLELRGRIRAVFPRALVDEYVQTHIYIRKSLCPLLLRVHLATSQVESHSPDPPLQFRTKFEASTQVCGPHTRTVEVPLASSAVWSQANALMIEGLGVCSVPSFPKAE